MQSRGLMAKGVPPQPVWLRYVKIAILVLAVIVLALAAWAISIIQKYTRSLPNGRAPGFAIFTTVFSFLVYGGSIALELWAPAMLFRIGALASYILSIIFWLTAWAWSASLASDMFEVIDYARLFDQVPKDMENLGAALGACAGLGALVWVLAIVHVVFFIRGCLAEPAGSAQAELGQVKHGEAPAPQQQFQQQQQQQQAYPAAAPAQQQPYPAQQPYPQQPYPQQPYPQQPYPQQPYPAQPQEYPAQPYPQQPYPTQ